MEQLPGLPVNGSVVGPMAGDLPTIEFALKAVLDTFPWQDDCDVVEMPWREEKLQGIRSRTAQRHERDGKLVFAVMACDGNVPVHPPVQRAMALVSKALLERGYEVRNLLKFDSRSCADDTCRLSSGSRHHTMTQFTF